MPEAVVQTPHRGVDGKKLTASREMASPTNILATARIRSRSHKDTSLALPVALVALREEEMKARAIQYQIGGDRWNGSLLYKSCIKDGQLNVILDPERTCALQNYSQHLEWSSWLTQLILGYYQSGQLNVSDACVGFDLLLALEYFGILYAPDQLVFETYQAYTRVRQWSDYFTHRTLIADAVANVVIYAPSQVKRHLWCTPKASSPNRAMYHGKIVNDLPNGREGDEIAASHAALEEFFGNSSSAELMRLDFALYLENILTCVEVAFPAKRVTIDNEEEVRGLLIVDVLSNETQLPPESSPIRTKSELSHPLDEKPTNHRTIRNQNVQRNQSHKSYEGSPQGVSDDIFQHVYNELEDKPPPPTGDYRPKIRRAPTGLSSHASVPIGYIDIGNVRSTDARSVTSALTGPFATEDNVRQAVPEDPQTQALRQEWIQGHLLNRDIQKRIRKILEDDGIIEAQHSEPSTTTSAPVSADESWEWVRSLCMTTYEAMKDTPCSELQDGIMAKVPTASTTPSSCATSSSSSVIGPAASSKEGPSAHPKRVMAPIKTYSIRPPAVSSHRPVNRIPQLDPPQSRNGEGNLGTDGVYGKSNTSNPVTSSHRKVEKGKSRTIRGQVKATSSNTISAPNKIVSEKRALASKMVCKKSKQTQTGRHATTVQLKEEKGRLRGLFARRKR